jgi:alkanesulfonate monooxygenase SsuD/methylene tetrahydromethanopterin reductase-like flavin-dependent oxidoreductase (luciferase family)
MVLLGYWASQEQYSMQNLLEFVGQAEMGGFTSVLTSDHFHPWWHDNGFGNFTWVWLAAAAERTKKIKFITGVTAAVYRYNPGIIAQAFASLDVLYPGRIGLGLGTGEAMNEVPLGFEWPEVGIRLDRTKEALQIISKLWKKGNREPIPTVTKTTDAEKSNEKYQSTGDHDKGENNGTSVNFEGKYFRLKNARLYTPPSTDIPLYMAASGPDSIQVSAKYADGLISTSKPDNAKETFDVFDKAAIEEGKDPATLEKIAKPKISYSEDYDEAVRACEFWRTSLIENVFDVNISDPIELQKKATQEISDDKLKQSILIVTKIDDLIKPIQEYFESGFTQVFTHSTSPDEKEFIQKFTKSVLPYFENEFDKERNR